MPTTRCEFLAPPSPRGTELPRSLVLPTQRPGEENTRRLQLNCTLNFLRSKYKIKYMAIIDVFRLFFDRHVSHVTVTRDKAPSHPPWITFSSSYDNARDF